MPPKKVINRDKSNPTDLDGPRKKPTIVGGVGSAYAANQPGEVGKPIPISDLGNLKTISDEEVPVKDQVSEQESVEEETQDSEEDGVDKDYASFLADAVTEEEDKNPKTFMEKYDTPENRAEFEKSLEPIDIADLIFQGFVEEIVSVLPGLEVTFRTINGTDVLGMERDTHDIGGSHQYLMRTMQLRSLAMSIVQINEKVLPSQSDEDRKFDKEAFAKKYDAICQLPGMLLDLLSIHSQWFEYRVQDAVTPDSLKN